MPALRQLRADAETWLAAAGIDQWRDPTTRPAALAKWEANIRNGRTWVIDNDDHDGLLATVTLAPPDRDFWRDADAPDSAVYIAKLITARQAKGEKLGGRILDWASSIACDRGLPWIRLDCWRDNTKLQDYYLRAGFRHVRTEAPAHRLSGWMAQRPASVVLHPGQELTTADTPVSAL